MSIALASLEESHLQRGELLQLRHEIVQRHVGLDALAMLLQQAGEEALANGQLGVDLLSRADRLAELTTP